MEKYGLATEGEWTAFSLGIKTGQDHSTPSPQTLKMIDSLRENIKYNDDKNTKEHEKILIAIFGDDHETVGMLQKVNEMHKVFVSTNLSTRFIIKIFATIGIVSGAIVGFIELIKRVK